ncbi:MAG: TonB-dependent receptor [Cyclobacteriaceae bacterium]|nr:TonB-dependent receptor [Cyclobacteriaceae bacterium]
MKNKYLLIVKMLSIYSFIGILFQAMLLNVLLANGNNAQELKSVKEVYINVDIHDANLVRTFKILEAKTPFKFAFEKDDLDKNLRVSLNAKNESLESVLLEISRVSGLQFRQVNYGIDVKRKKEIDLREEKIEIVLQSTTISGRVTSSDDPEGLPGVNVMIKGTSRGIVTDIDGRYSIEVAGTETILVFSSVGYATEEVTIGNRTVIDVVLLQDITALQEIVVVGYGEQKKINMTGSVATISADNIESRAVTNVSSSLAGLAAGVQVIQSSGRPGSDGAAIRIRGTGTLNNNAPLVIIDGIMGNMDDVNPNDIESISILKDAASASIYGSLAANGVILITTKKGTRGQMNVTYTGLYSTTSPMNLIPFVTDYAEHMRLMNQGHTNVGQQAIFAQSTIDAWEAATANPNGTNDIGVPNWLAYPNTDWANEIFENLFSQNHNVGVNGGNKDVRYNLSFGYLDNPGTIRNTGIQRYQVRANIDAKLNDWITIGTQTFFSTLFNDRGNPNTAFQFLNQTTPGLVPKYNGLYGWPHAQEESGTANNIRRFLDETGGSDQTTRLNSTFYGIFNLAKGLTFESRFNYQTRFQEVKNHSNPITRWDFARDILMVEPIPPSLLSTSYSFNKDYMFVADQVLRYQTNIGGVHDFGALAGYNQTYFNFYNVGASMRGLIDYNITTFNSANEVINASGDEYDWALRSWFGRVNYGYKQKYLFEANLRYDGSSRFAEESRYGVFPSFSAGWNISQEGFASGLSSVVEALKLRASWGRLGNNVTGPNQVGVNNYRHLATYGSVGYSFNGSPVIGLAQGRFANPFLQWESTTVGNIGIEGVVLNGALDFEIDLYQRYTDGILTTPPIFLTAGIAGAPVANTAAVVNRGVELALNWRKQIGEVSLNLTGNFAYNFNQVDKYKGRLEEGWVIDESGNRVYRSNLGDVSDGGNQRILEGHIINEYFLLDLHYGTGPNFNSDGSVNPLGGPSDGMIRTPADLEWVQAMIGAGNTFLPVRNVAKNQLWYGDYIYADTNGDGLFGNMFDRTLTGTSNLPRYNFGFITNAAWKNFDVSMVWSGAAGFELYWNQDSYNNSSVRNGFAFPQHIVNDVYFYDENDLNNPYTNVNAKFPRLKSTDGQNNQPSRAWLYDGSFVKLRNLQIGYTIPSAISERALIRRARVFLNGENLLLITKYPGIDPEIGANIGYPTMRQMAVGINVTF